MTQQQESVVANVLTEELACDYYHEDQDKFLAEWSLYNRPSFEKLRALEEKTRQFGGKISIREATENGKFEVTIKKVA